MNYAIVLGVIAAILLLVKYMMGRARTDGIWSALQIESQRRQREELEKSLQKLTQEVRDATIRYNNARRKFDELASDSTVPGTDKGVSGSDQ